MGTGTKAGIGAGTLAGLMAVFAISDLVEKGTVTTAKNLIYSPVTAAMAICTMSQY